mmetsp:Transcript_46001/g.82839  ORF Transcript_46001/g.82839 Transcript_46001/m.82839 type:complete len:208 (-) Transcript_46001:58-681(-)
MMEFQNWLTTKVDPRADTKKRAIIKPVAEVTAALAETTMVPQVRSMQSVKRGPKYSITEPMMKRVKTSNETAARFALPMAALHAFLHTQPFTFSASGSKFTASWLSQIPMSTRTTLNKGAKANQPTNARQKASVAAQKARMCGLVLTRFPQCSPPLKGLNSVLLFWSSTATSHSIGSLMAAILTSQLLLSFSLVSYLYTVPSDTRVC